MKLRCHCLLNEASSWCGPSGTVPAKSSHRAILCDLTGQQQKHIFLQVPGYSGDEKHTGTGPGNEFRKRMWWLSVPQPPPFLFKAEPFGGCSSPCPGCGATSAQSFCSSSYLCSCPGLQGQALLPFSPVTGAEATNSCTQSQMSSTKGWRRLPALANGHSHEL